MNSDRVFSSPHLRSGKVETTLSVTDAVLEFTDLDGQVHKRTYVAEPYWESPGDEPYIPDMERKARHEFSYRKVVTTDDGVMIPTCNIKSAEVKKNEPRAVTLTWLFRSPSQWTRWERVSALFVTGFFACILTAVVCGFLDASR